MERCWPTIGSPAALLAASQATADPAGATAELVKIDGCTLVFQIEAHDEKEPIGSGSHKRVVVNVARFDQRIQKKLGAWGERWGGVGSPRAGEKVETLGWSLSFW